jgi:hypothetical protein
MVAFGDHTFRKGRAYAAKPLGHGGGAAEGCVAPALSLPYPKIARIPRRV